jgi:hypothetical protein
MLCGYGLARCLIEPEDLDRGRHRAGYGALGRPAREMLELRLEPEVASKLIDCIERMAAAARLDDDATS